jgi:glycosyltransferase involved in cell wall biosynthesis
MVLRGELPGDSAGPPLELVLRERALGREVRVGLTVDGAGGAVSGAIEATALLTDEAETAWDVGVHEIGRAGGAETYRLESALDTASVPSVTLRRDDRLHRMRLHTSRAGGLTLAAGLMPPHAEVRKVLVDDEAVVVEAVLDRIVPPAGSRSAALVATRRTGKDEVTAPAVVDGPHVHARMPLARLAALADDVPDTEYWDLSLRIDGCPPLRLGGHLDDVRDKKNAIVFPATDVPSPGGARSLRPYFTVHNNLSIRSTRVPAPAAPTAAPSASPEDPTGAPAPSVVARRATHVARAVAMVVARTVVRRLPTRRAIPPVRDGRPHVSILIIHGYGMGGTVRTVFNQAAYLSRDHDVEVVSQVRDRKEPFFPLPPGVTLTPLDDRTEAGRPPWPLRWIRDRLGRLPSLLVHEADGSFARCSLWTDIQLVRRFRAQQGGIVMATRPSLNLLLAQLAAPGVVTVGQEHMNFQGKRPELARDLHRSYRRLDALTVLTRGDLEDYSRVLAGSGTRVVRIPNAVSPLTGGLADPTSTIVVAAGRLTNQKGFDRLLPAFEHVVRAHPEWTLRIYGSGPHRGRLRRMITDRGLSNNVLLMGRAERMGEELAKASIYAMSSRFEGFPMVLLEAMSKGLPVVSFDCPRGPSDLITPGENGLLVPNGDIDGLADGLLELVGSEDRRRSFGAAALETAARYSIEAIGRQWDDLFDRLLAERSPSWWRPESGS